MVAFTANITLAPSYDPAEKGGMTALESEWKLLQKPSRNKVQPMPTAVFYSLTD